MLDHFQTRCEAEKCFGHRNDYCFHTTCISGEAQKCQSFPTSRPQNFSHDTALKGHPNSLW